MYPILCKVRYETLHRTLRQKALWVQIGFSLVVNWIVAPLFMVCFLVKVVLLGLAVIIMDAQLALAWAFLPDERGLREGLILVGIARCIAMVRCIFL